MEKAKRECCKKARCPLFMTNLKPGCTIPITHDVCNECPPLNEFCDLLGMEKRKIITKECVRCHEMVALSDFRFGYRSTVCNDCYNETNSYWKYNKEKDPCYDCVLDINCVDCFNY